MKTLKFIILVVIAFSSLSTLSQQQKRLKLKVGDVVPDIDFNMVLDSPYRNLKLSDFRGKIVILDYWNKWCGSCLEAFPKLQILQQKYKDQVVIIPISFLHKQQVVKDFLSNRKKLGLEIKLPFVVFENTQNKLFELLPTVGYPHCIWINKEGKVLSQSSTEYINDDNIQRSLKGEKLEMPERDFQMDFNNSKPLLTGGNGGTDTAFVYRSLFTKFNNRINYTINKEFDSNRKRVYALNQTALELIKYSLYKGVSKDPFNQHIVFDQINTNDYVFNGDKDEKYKWEQQNQHCYELILPPEFTNDEVFNIMHEDLDRFFKIKSFCEMRSVNCLVLRRIDSIDHIKSRTGNFDLSYSANKTNISMKGIAIPTLISFITMENSPIIIDDTKYTNLIDIKINISKPFDLEVLNVQLIKSGFKLFNEKRQINMIVITNK